MNDNKKILYIITKSVWGGAGKYVYDLAGAAKTRGYEVAVAAGGQGELAIKLKEQNVRYFDVAELQRDVAVLKPFISGLVLLKILFKFRPDIVHANSPQAAGICGIAIFLYRLFPHTPGVWGIYTIHGWTFHEDRPVWQNFLIRLFSKITCVFYQKIICVSEYDRLSALKFKIAPAHKLLTIHNGIDPSEINFLPREEARNRLNLSKAELLTIGTIGEFTKNKGYEYLIEVARLLNANIQLKIVIIAWGKDYEKTAKQIKSAELSEKVFLIKDLVPASPYLKAFDVFILPSLKEGLPYTLLEAGLAGLPVVATSVGGIPEIIENEKTGLLVRPSNTGELTDAINRLVNDTELRQKLGRNLREKVLKDFSASEMLEKTFRLYK